MATGETGQAQITVEAPQGTTPGAGGYDEDEAYAKIVVKPFAFAEWDGDGTYWKAGP